jgi:hypothetical protein
MRVRSLCGEWPRADFRIVCRRSHARKEFDGVFAKGGVRLGGVHVGSILNLSALRRGFGAIAAQIDSNLRIEQTATGAMFIDA